MSTDAHKNQRASRTTFNDANPKQGYAYEGKIILTDSLGRVTQFDVAGYLHALGRNDAAKQVIWQLFDDARRRDVLGEEVDDRDPGAR